MKIGIRATILAFVAVASAGVAAAREIRIVGSSTVFPFSTTVAEQFGANTNFPTPIVEANGSGSGIKLFCEGVGPFRWIAVSGNPQDIYTIDDMILEAFSSNHPISSWIECARSKTSCDRRPKSSVFLGCDTSKRRTRTPLTCSSPAGSSLRHVM